MLDGNLISTRYDSRENIELSYRRLSVIVDSVIECLYVFLMKAMISIIIEIESPLPFSLLFYQKN